MAKLGHRYETEEVGVARESENQAREHSERTNWSTSAIDGRLPPDLLNSVAAQLRRADPGGDRDADEFSSAAPEAPDAREDHPGA